MRDALAALRHRWMQAGPACPGGEAALAEHARWLDPRLAQGQLQALHRGDGTLAAAVLVCHEPEEPFYRAPVTHLVAHHDGSPEGLSWLAAALARTVPGLPDDVECLVPAADAATLRMLTGLGLGPTTVLLAGRVGPARAALQARWRPPADLRHLGLELSPAEPQDADEIVDLLRRVFGAEPAYAWFMASEARLAHRREELARGRGSAMCLLVHDGPRLVGLLEAGLRPDDPHYGPSVGVGLVLDASVRRRGIAPVAYHHALALAEEHGAAWLKGATARRAVLHMAEVMGRQPVAVHVRRTPCFRDGRFDACLGAVARAGPLTT